MRKNFYLSFFVWFILLLSFDRAIAQIKPETMQQIQALLQEKESRTPAQRKIASQLLQASREQRGEKMAAGVNLLPVKLKTDISGVLSVDISANVTDALINKITALGGQIIYPSKQYKTIRARVPLSTVEKIATFSEITFIKPAVISRTVGSGNHQNNTKAGTPVSLMGGSTIIPSVVRRQTPATKRLENVKKQMKDYVMMLGTGSVNSEGDHPHRADDARNTFGYAGQTIKIGVLSDSYNANGTATASILSGNLPGIGNPIGNTTPVTVLQDYPGATDEGQAMLQIVHDIAPKAQLFFATADVSEAGFANNILALRNVYHCDVIIDDVGYFDEPSFQDGIVAQAVNTVSLDGAMYFSSAGNAGSVKYGLGSIYEGDFNNSGSLAFTGSAKGGTIHNFGTVAVPVNGDIITAPESTTAGDINYYTLNWADPFGASSNDYDLFLVNAAGVVKGSSTNVQSGSIDPYEEIDASETSTPWVSGDRLVVFKTDAAAVRAFHLSAQSDGVSTLAIATPGSTDGHACAAYGFCVAATPAPLAYPNPFVATNTVEDFSSDGPRRVFYNPDNTPVSPGNFTFASGGFVTRAKPDITAADGVSTSLASFTPFYGTSAAAPHAGAIAALLLSANNTLATKFSTAQIRNILTSTALDIEAPGYDYNSGYGILQAYQAVQAVGATPLPNITVGTTTVAEGSFSNSNGGLDPGETGNITVQVKNVSLGTATNATATVVSNTTGVIVTSGSFNYGTLAPGASATSTVPFTFAINSTVACGTTLNFSIVVTFGGGGPSPASGSISATMGELTTYGSIAGKIGTPAAAGTNYTSSTGTQTGRESRGGVTSTCAVPVTAPGLTITTGARQYDAYVFTNSTGASQCFTATLTGANNANLFTVAYNNSGFLPTNPNTNFLAEPAQSTAVQQYSFTVASGRKFTIVVHAVDSLTNPGGNEVGSAYNLAVTYIACAAKPACTNVSVTTASIASGAIGTPYIQHFAATGGSGLYVDSLTGNLPAGLKFAGDSLSGTPTQAGTFAVTFKATDPAGCPAGTMTYSLVISGIAPASIIATAGTPQSALINNTFPTALQATVKDASSNLLPGVNVMFTAPSTGASGTFAGGTSTATVVTDANGSVTAPAFTANATNGTFNITAAVNGVTPSATYSLTNTCPPTIVTSGADSGPGTLRYILANSCANPVITFDPSVTSIVLTSGEIALTKAVTIVGPGADKLSISGGFNSRIFNITAGSGVIDSISGVTLRDGFVPETETLSGGAILINSGTVKIGRCAITNNDAEYSYYGEGGAIDNEGGTLTIDRSTIYNNTSYSDGGGITQYAGSLTMTNSTLAYNNASAIGSAGGGIYGVTAVTLTNVTVYGNTASLGGNLYRNAGNTTLKNCIVAGGILNTTLGTGPDINGTVRSSDYNLFQTTTGGTVSQTTTHNITNTNPKLLPLANYGGPTPTMLPMSSSVAIDAGDPTLLATATDQRGFSRKVGTSADMGAVETNYTFALTAGTPQSTAVSTPFASVLQTTVKESGNSIAGDSVLFSAPTTGASGTFTGSSSTAKVVTDASGIATAPTFTANATVGTYNVKDSIGAAFAALNFVLTNNMATPVTFGAITATVTNCTAQIVWETLSESNSKDFTVEYSTDGVHYTALATLPAAGTSNAKLVYRYLHTSLMNGTNYYRIKQTDLDGAFTYSSIVIVASACGNAPIVAYPNPVKNNLTVVLPGTDRQTITITDAIGRRIDRYTVNGGTQAINANSWAKGMYALTVTKDGVTTFVMKVIKD